MAELHPEGDRLQMLRGDRRGRGEHGRAPAEPLVINCGHRCFRHNKEVGGVAHSQHLTLAFDVRMPKERHEAFIKLARKCGFRGIGHRDYENFVHLDMGPEREW